MLLQYLLLLLFPIGMAGGQILFKLTAVKYSKSSSVFSFVFSWSFITAILLYGITTIGWILVLKRTALSRAYPIVALSFVIVPIASSLLFNEPLSVKYFIGIALIVAGIFFTVYK